MILPASEELNRLSGRDHILPRAGLKFICIPGTSPADVAALRRHRPASIESCPGQAKDAQLVKIV
jgi:hypothetical protein